MRCWKKQISLIAFTLLLAACTSGAQAPAQLAVRTANIAHGVLSARLEWRPREVVVQALDHGIALDFALTLSAEARDAVGWNSRLAQTVEHIELRYFPLTRQYQLRDPDVGSTRSFASRALLTAAFEDLRLVLPADWSTLNPTTYRLNIELERDRLPGAMRLPAMLQPSWRSSTGDFTWPAADAD